MNIYFLRFESINKSVAIGLFLFLFCNCLASAHGIHFETTQYPPAVTVKAFFSASAPLADVQVSVMAPGNNQPWQTGRTDKAGNFTFLPDQTGEWVVSVDDERGHIGRSTVTITEVFFERFDQSMFGDESPETITERVLIKTEDGKELVKEVSRVVSRTEAHDDGTHRHVEEVVVEKKSGHEGGVLFRIILGLALIFGITGILYGWKARQDLKKANAVH